MLVVKFEKEKETKNTIKFGEIGAPEMGAPRVGTIYIPKATLKEMGWKKGEIISMSLEVE